MSWLALMAITPLQSESFFLFDKACESKVSDAEVQALNYLKDQDTSFGCLTKYPVVKKTFMKYNTTLPSSAHIERLFSFAGMINNAKRYRLSDHLFEKLVVLKGNYSS